MKNLKKTHSRIVAKAKSGVEGLMKVYERYLQIVSPKNRQSNSNASLLAW